jgi:hypothetical membrane protein
MKAMRASEEATGATSASALPRWLAAAGIVGPAVFTVVVLVQQFYRRSAYDPIEQLVSDLTAGPYGWVQQVNFVAFGLLLIAFAVGLQRVLRPARAGVAGPAIIAWNGVGLMVGGLFPLREDANGVVYDPIGVHTVNGTVFFLTIGIGLVVVSRRLRGDPRWLGLAGYTFATGTAVLAMVVAIVALVRPADAPLHEWLGLAQRIVLVPWLLCVFVLALRLRRITSTS